jgi:glycerophosphoryl diester phosphodiesterase
MKILSHRGYWKAQSEKNNTIAFRRSFELGFGTETDVRDCCGELVISHDMPNGRELKLGEFLALVASYPSDPPLTLALNVKADGMASKLKEKLKEYATLDYFFFDMSIPDMRSYINLDLPTYTRISEYESIPIWENDAKGIWLDGFESDWFENDLLIDLLRTSKPICIVSPELHGRPHEGLWNRIRPLKAYENLFMCTDFPETARKFFEE